MEKDNLAVSKIKSCSVNEALRMDTRSVEVQENSELHLSPLNQDYSDCFAKVQIKSYNDLQLLGLVPKGISEETIRKAIINDDDEAYKLASNIYQKSNCNCKNQSKQLTNYRLNTFRQTYVDIRKNHHPSLAKIVSNFYHNKNISWDAPVVKIIKQWHDNLETVFPRPVFILVVKDIIIYNNATLVVGGLYTTSLLAHDIIIYETGRLMQQGRYLKIWANSIKRGTPSVVLTNSEPSPWLVT